MHNPSSIIKLTKVTCKVISIIWNIKDSFVIFLFNSYNTTRWYWWQRFMGENIKHWAIHFFIHVCYIYRYLIVSIIWYFQKKIWFFLNCFRVCYRKFFTHPWIVIYIKRIKFTTKNQVDFLMWKIIHFVYKMIQNATYVVPCYDQSSCDILREPHHQQWKMAAQEVSRLSSFSHMLLYLDLNFAKIRASETKFAVFTCISRFRENGSVHFFLFK